MAKTAQCPSCGAKIAFRAGISIVAVCEFCRSTLVRHDKDIENIGRQADLIEDASLVQLGTEGQYRGVHFAVIGRLQLKYGAGLWNEWHILFDDQRSGWLGEASGEYLITFPVPGGAGMPPFGELRPGVAVTAAGRRFTVTDLESATCIAMEGELPFRVDSGYEVNAADLRSEDGRFGTIDYSETPPLLFVGEPVKFESLKFANLREKNEFAGAPQLKAGQVKAFACPSCAAPLSIHSDRIEVVACGSCGSVIGAADENLQIIATVNRQARVEPRVPLGSKGKLRGTEWEIIGFMRRQSEVEGVKYPWSEYLLFEAKQGFAWLIEYKGHWNFARTLSETPSVRMEGTTPEIVWKNEVYSHFQSAPAEVTYVVGEFYWRVSVGEKVKANDYILPPKMLTREASDSELTWSLGEYLEPEEVRDAFKLKAVMPARVGVYANQPNPHVADHRRIWALFWIVSLVALIGQIGFQLSFPSKVVHTQTFAFHGGDNESMESAPFRLEKASPSLVVETRSNLSNNWLMLDVTLVERESGEARSATSALWHESGVDDGESWSEGNQVARVRFGDTPPGTYYLVVDGEAPPGLRRSLGSTVEVRSEGPGWFNWLLLQALLLIAPLISRARLHAFEMSRWMESDHPPEDSSSDDSEDD